MNYLIIAVFLTGIGGLCMICRILANRNEKLIDEIDSLKIENKKLCKQIFYLSSLTLSKQKSKPTEIPKGTIEAVRYAMIHSHPDNGGSSEKFILYKECYEKLTKGMKK